MPDVIINGRRINIPGSSVKGKEIIDRIKPDPGRRVVFRVGTEAKPINPYHYYEEHELIDIKRRVVKVVTIPDRVKGTFGNYRSQSSKQIITEQVYDIAAYCFKSGVEFDEDNANWLTIPKYFLPERWHYVARATPLKIVFPTEYPVLPPIGFYLDINLGDTDDSHIFNNVYHEASQGPIDEGWKWYCVYIPRGNWRPARVRKSGDWKYGDNLWTYFTLIKEVLTDRND